jgi:hypothetical protein
MEPPFRIKADLQRVIERGHAFPLGVAGGGGRPEAWGWCRTNRPSQDEHPASLTWTVVVSHEKVRPLLMDFFRLMPDAVVGILELGSRDAYRAVDVFLSRSTIDTERFRGAWDLFEPILLEDATLAVGVIGEEPFIEVFLDQDKRILVHGEPTSATAIESVLRRFNLEQRTEKELIVPVILLETTVTRPILEDWPERIVDSDQLLMDLRGVWDLVLDEDPEQNLDGLGRNIGRTLWHGVVLLDQEDVAGRREGHGHFWGVASSRREMEDLVVAYIESEEAWELLDVLSLDRAAFDDRPESLDALTPRMSRRGVLLWHVDAIDGTSEWVDDDERL